MLGTDVMEDAGDSLADPVVEPFSGLGMDGATSIFLAGMAHGVVTGEAGAGRDEGLPFIAHQMGLRRHARLQHPLENVGFQEPSPPQ